MKGLTQDWEIYARGEEKVTFTRSYVRSHVKKTDTNHREPISILCNTINDYLKSPEWAALAPSTRYNWNRTIERIRARWGETPIAIWSEPQQLMEVVKWRNEYADKPRTSDHQLTVLHHFLAWARLHGAVTVNIASNIPRLYKGVGRAEIIWHDNEIARFCAAATVQVADGMRLAALTGLRRADLIRLDWSEIEENKVVRITRKSRRRRKRAIIPLTPALRELLDELVTRRRKPGVTTVLVNGLGKSWTEESFSHAFRQVRDRLQVRHTDGRMKHLHDVRGTYATRLVLLGLSDQEVGDIMGWSAAQVGEVRKLYVHDDTALRGISDRLASSEGGLRKLSKLNGSQA